MTFDSRVIPQGRVVDPMTGIESLGLPSALPGVYGPAAMSVPMLKTPAAADYAPLRALSNAEDGLSADPNASDLAGVVGHGAAFNGASWDRTRTASAVNVGAQSGLGALLVAGPGEWSVTAERTDALPFSVSRPAAAGRHVLRALQLMTWATTASATAAQVFRVRDGAAGVGPILWAGLAPFRGSILIQAIVSGLSIVGSPNTPMTFELDAGPGAPLGPQLVLTMSGYTAA